MTNRTNTGSPFAEPKLGRPKDGDNSTRTNSRIQLKLNQSGRERMDELRRRMNSSTSDIVRDALRVYELLTEELITKGNEVLLVDHKKDTPERLILFAQQKRATA